MPRASPAPDDEGEAEFGNGHVGGDAKATAAAIMAEANSAARSIQSAQGELVAEATGAKYVWVEVAALRDMLRWCEPTDAEGVTDSNGQTFVGTFGVILHTPQSAKTEFPSG